MVLKLGDHASIHGTELVRIRREVCYKILEAIQISANKNTPLIEIQRNSFLIVRHVLHPLSLVTIERRRLRLIRRPFCEVPRMLFLACNQSCLAEIAKRL
jgi:hypothetical protein